MDKKWPPIKLERRYANPNGTGQFIIVAVPLPVDVETGATDEELLARRKAEKEAIDREWQRYLAAI